MSASGRPHVLRRAVAIGGGHGLSRTLQSLTRVVDHVTAVVTVADDGGSSGRLRRDLDVVPPGDLRQALAALAVGSRLPALLQYRFERGELAGHALGNLVLVALADLHGGDMQAALDDVARLLGAPGRVVPCSTTPMTLHAKTRDGEVAGQLLVAGTRHVEQVWADPASVAANPAALEALDAADLVVLGPGSLFTSLLPNLLVPDIAAAVAAVRAPVAFVANLREQPGETEGMDLPDHLEALRAHAPSVRPTVLVAHDGPTPSGPGRPLKIDPAAVEAWVPQVVTADVLDGEDGHDPAKLADVLAGLLERGVREIE